MLLDFSWGLAVDVVLLTINGVDFDDIYSSQLPSLP